jgi:hypothetical protein
METSSMKNQEIINKLNMIDEDLGFLEEVTDRSLVEDRIEDLKLLRNELERKLQYDKVGTFKADQKSSKED